MLIRSELKARREITCSAANARFAWSLPLFVAALAVSRPALSEDAATAPAVTSNATKARALFEAGVAFSEQGRWAEAERNFAESAALEGSPNCLLNLAVTRFYIGRPAAALEALDRIGKSNVKPSPEQQQRATLIRERVRTQIVTLSITVDPPHAQVRVDGRIVPSAQRRMYLDPGQHVVSVSAEGYARAEQQLQLTPGTTREASFALSPSNAARTQPAPSARPRSPSTATSLSQDDAVGRAKPAPKPEKRVTDERKASWWQSPWLWVGIGVLATGTAVTVVALTSGGEVPPSGGSEGKVITFDF